MMDDDGHMHVLQIIPEIRIFCFLKKVIVIAFAELEITVTDIYIS